ncbi:Trypsin 5G1 [Phytophthora citrophthora]|uniref:Trypsin 5G1 n=1 Tax=Phytophthora citrophthora TaxID=4793 RepID=A0AAD9GLG5_9STRA|nr:Trypsin 5G1 [Phytophthora citrophthora]
MKTISALTVATIALGAVSGSPVERQLVAGGNEVPVGTKAYTTGVRFTPDGANFCGGILVTPNLVLTTATCTSIQEARFVSVGSHFSNGSMDGEQIEVHHAENHTFYNSSTASYDFALLTLLNASSIAPVKLPQSDDSDIAPGVWANVMGWGEKSFGNGTRSNELQSVELEVKDCAAFYTVDNSSVCAGGVAGKDSCNGDEGGPLVKENGKGDADDVLIGLVGWGSSCGTKGTPAVYSRVSAALEWIKNVTAEAEVQQK